MTKRHVITTDNRDTRTTALILDSNDCVDVDPVELVLNMTENCFGPGVFGLTELFVQYLEGVEESEDDDVRTDSDLERRVADFLVYLKEIGHLPSEVQLTIHVNQV